MVEIYGYSISTLPIIVALTYGMIEILQNKLVEIFLNCGKVVMCGLNECNKNLIGVHDRLYFVNNERDAFEYLYI